MREKAHSGIRNSWRRFSLFVFIDIGRTTTTTLTHKMGSLMTVAAIDTLLLDVRVWEAVTHSLHGVALLMWWWFWHIWAIFSSMCLKIVWKISGRESEYRPLWDQFLRLEGHFSNASGLSRLSQAKRVRLWHYKNKCKSPEFSSAVNSVPTFTTSWCVTQSLAVSKGGKSICKSIMALSWKLKVKECKDGVYTCKHEPVP